MRWRIRAHLEEPGQVLRGDRTPARASKCEMPDYAYGGGEGDVAAMSAAGEQRKVMETRSSRVRTMSKGYGARNSIVGKRVRVGLDEEGFTRGHRPNAFS